MFQNNSMSPADFNALMGGNNDGWGNSSWLWFIVIIFALFGGWGNGWGNNGGGAVADQYVLASDFATLQRQLDSATDRLAQQSNQIANGLSSLGYDQLNQMNGINTNILTNSNAIQTEIANCCCSNKSAMADLNYNLATQANGINNAITSGFCQTNYNNANNTRDIIDSQCANTRSILEAIQNNRVEQMQAKIADQQAQIQALNLSASQQAQNQYLISQLHPAPVPSFPASNLYGYYGCGCGCNS